MGGALLGSWVDRAIELEGKTGAGWDFLRARSLAWEIKPSAIVALVMIALGYWRRTKGWGRLLIAGGIGCAVPELRSRVESMGIESGASSRIAQRSTAGRSGDLQQRAERILQRIQGRQASTSTVPSRKLAGAA